LATVAGSLSARHRFTRALPRRQASSWSKCSSSGTTGMMSPILGWLSGRRASDGCGEPGSLHRVRPRRLPWWRG
jgi:hypothetical protein